MYVVRLLRCEQRPSAKVSQDRRGRMSAKGLYEADKVISAGSLGYRDKMAL